MDFNINNFGTLEVTEGLSFNLTETLLVTWIVMAILLALAIIVRVKSKKWNSKNKPKGLQNFIEMCVDAFERFFKGSSSEKVTYLAPWFFALFAFLLMANIIGLVGLRPPTADWGLTFPLAMASFVMFQYAGFRYRPKAYMKGFLKPFAVFLPLNILGEFARPIALSFRLFGNILGGVILMSLLYELAPTVLTFVLPVALHAYFDLAAGALQAFIFTVLSITFVGLAAED